jgi:hypothetical protein
MAVSISGTNGVTFPDSSLQAAAASPYVLKNRIINGDMRIDQRYAGAATANTINGYTVDRWIVAQNNSTGKLIAQQNQGSVTPPAGFTNYLGVTSQSSYSLGSSDWYTFQYNIEGYNVADLAYGTANAKTCVLSFWVRSSLTGTFVGTLGNAPSTREYPYTYTISNANTWEQKTITVNGDTSGSWNTTNGIGLYIMFGLGFGSSFQTGTANSTWATTSTISVPSGGTSIVGTSGATFYITGVQLEIGSTATPFERRLYNQELANCQRYYTKFSGSSDASLFAGITLGVTSGGTTVDAVGTFPVAMRTTPTANYSTLRVSDVTTIALAVNAITELRAMRTNYTIILTVTGGTFTANRPCVLQLNNSSSGYLDFSAEL